MIAQDVRLAAFNYVLEEDRKLPEKDQTIFKLQPLSYSQTRVIDDLLGTAFRNKTNPLGTMNHKLLNYGLMGWENMKDNNGGEIKFKRNKEGDIPDDLFMCFTREQRSELASEIWGGSKIEDEEEKN
jgi:hypothetical protein